MTYLYLGKYIYEQQCYSFKYSHDTEYINTYNIYYIAIKHFKLLIIKKDFYNIVLIFFFNLDFLPVKCDACSGIFW